MRGILQSSEKVQIALHNALNNDRGYWVFLKFYFEKLKSFDWKIVSFKVIWCTFYFVTG